MATKPDGSAWAWGANVYGQLGDNTTVDKHTPAQVSGLSGVVAIGAGEFSTLALTANGAVFAWVYNDHGQLGDNTTVDKHTPVQVAGFSLAAPVGDCDSGGVAVCNGAGVCGVPSKPDGSLWCVRQSLGEEDVDVES